MSNERPYGWGKRYAIAFFVLMSIPFSLLTFHAYLMGSMPDEWHLLVSLVFLSLWFGIGWCMGDWGNGIAAFTWFWGGGALLLGVGYGADELLLALPALFVHAGPVYGIRYVIRMPSDHLFALLCIALAYTVCLVGWLTGRRAYRGKHSNRGT